MLERLYTKGTDAVTGGGTYAPYKRYRFDITRKVKPGRSYQIRFAAIARGDTINLGVDNVSVKAE